MPLFTYQCAKCGAESEILVGSAAARPACPSCGGRNMTRMASAFAPQSAKAAGDPAPRCQSCPSAGGGCPYQR
ncbi:MAG: zinc ribbon domain-containing protein [Candidatus Hydrogenedentes bacterium]|jgi:putative FmdB family regulatory protein|nr:zinc ribbon domain-containing protein [Candidatus Hydrogenedentota bacterium]NLT62503.1 zinc ribbon domain-containing protein [Candidatus Hydrogenedentota bacterium]